MKRFARIAIKWTLIAGGAYWLSTTLIFGDESIDADTGMYNYRWSGLDALFNKEKFGLAVREPVVAEFEGPDGPYILDGHRYAVGRDKAFHRASISAGQAFNVEVDNPDQDKFQFALRASHSVEDDTYPMPKRLIAISDIEGNYDAFYSFLVKNGVMDKDYQWTFGDGHLVLNGDFVDRGTEVSEVLWLIYALEEKAKAHGGKVHFILGNHEIMNMQGNSSYADMKYIAAAQKISGLKGWNQATQFLYSEKSETGRWLRTKNVAEKIGPYIFVHGGLNMSQVDAGLTLPEMNQIARQFYGKKMSESPVSGKAAIALSRYHSPYWDRSLSMNLLLQGTFLMRDPLNAPLRRTTQEELDKVLAHFGAGTVVVGHTVVNQVQFDYGGKVIKMDVKHGRDKDSPNTQGFLIEGGKAFRVDGLGGKTELK
jgi:hypothetical protein